MPLVGVDWSQTGVAHLFSAIKVCHIVCFGMVSLKMEISNEIEESTDWRFLNHVHLLLLLHFFFWVHRSFS